MTDTTTAHAVRVKGVTAHLVRCAHPLVPAAVIAWCGRRGLPHPTQPGDRQCKTCRTLAQQAEQ